MIKFCKIDGIYYMCDDETIKLRNLTVEKEIDEQEYIRLGGDFYQINDDLIIGKNPKGEAQRQIAELKSQLAGTDYIANKLTEAIVKYIETGDNTKLVELSKKYETQLEQRQLWRDRITECEKILNC